VAAASAVARAGIAAQLEQFHLEEAVHITREFAAAAVAKTTEVKPKRKQGGATPQRELTPGRTRQASRLNVGDTTDLLAPSLAAGAAHDHPSPSLSAGAPDSQTTLAPVDSRLDTPEGPAIRLQPHDLGNATVALPEARTMAAAATEPRENTELQAQVPMIVDASAETADTPDPNATTAAAAGSSQVGADPVRQSAGDLFQQSEEYYVRIYQEQNTIANDPNMPNEKRTAAAAPAESAGEHFQAVRQQRGQAARAQGEEIETSAAATAVPTRDNGPADRNLYTLGGCDSCSNAR
jgi:hypothetical protein